MKIWRTATTRMRCGYDPDHSIATGELYLEIEDGARVKRVRCGKCAPRHEALVVADEPVEALAPAAEPAPQIEPEPQAEPILETEQDPW